LAHFLLYNLLPSLVAGALVWLLVVAAFNLLPIRQAVLRLCLLWMPLAKSLFVLLGVGLILPWPEPFFRNWQTTALSPRQVIPFLLLWAGGATLLYGVVVRRVRQRLLREAQPAPQRLERTLDDVLAAYRQTASCRCDNGLFCSAASLPRPQLFISGDVRSPLVLTAGGAPTSLFPAGLAGRLDDHELAGALAHEVTHFGLRWPGWCSVSSVGALRKLAVVSPVAGLVSAHIHQEEEKACDDMAVRITGDREAYADMLLKSYRYALAQDESPAKRLAFLPQLLGRRPALSERVERLLHEPAPTAGQPLQVLLTLLLWLAASVLIFQF
jgi:Zn-dependent protease with chaperone function